MNLIMSDTPLLLNGLETAETYYVDLSGLKIATCVGCFGCWVKTPGKCVVRDDAVQVYPLIARSTRVLYVTRVCFGGYDTPMKAMLERAIPTQKAFLRLHHGETHHVQRAVAEKDAVILAYGCPTAEEQQLFRRLVARNASNMLFRNWRVRFVDEAELNEAAEQEAAAWKS